MSLNEFELQFMTDLEEDWNTWGRKMYLNWTSFVYNRWRQHHAL